MEQFIENNEVTGLDVYRELTDMSVNFISQKIFISYDEYQKTPTGQKCLFEAKQITLQDSPEVVDNDGQAITPAKTGYSESYANFGGNQIEGAINEFLKNIPIA